jgi:hypothetical protein
LVEVRQRALQVDRHEALDRHEPLQLAWSPALVEVRQRALQVDRHEALQRARPPLGRPARSQLGVDRCEAGHLEQAVHPDQA